MFKNTILATTAEIPVVKLVMPLAEAIASSDFDTANQYVQLSDRGNAIFQTVLTTSVQPNGYTIIQSTAVPTISFVLMVTGPVNVRHVGIDGSGNVDTAAAFQFLGNLGISVQGNPEDNYLLLSKVSIADKDFDFDMRGGTFIEDTTDGQTFQIRNNLVNTTSVTALNSVVVELSALTTLTLANSASYSVGDVIKVVCDDRIRPNVLVLRGEYKAEYAVVTSKAGSVITLDRTLIFINSSSTNIRTARLVKRKFRFVNTNFSLHTERNTYTFPYHISCEGFITPQFQNLNANSAAGILIRTLSCYGARGDNITGDNLLNDTASGKYGYGVTDYGSQASNWYNLKFDKCRHAYTTGSDEIIVANTPALISYGGAVRCQVWNGICTGATSFAWDTHPDAWECVFHDVVSTAGRSTVANAWTGGFQDSGYNTVVHKLTCHTNTVTNTAVTTPVYFGRDSEGTKINKLIMYGDNLKVANNSESSLSTFYIKEIDIYSNMLSNRLFDFNTVSTIRVGKINQFIQGEILTGTSDMYLINLQGTGAFYLNECNIYADAGSTQVVTIPNYQMVRVGTASLHKGIFAKFNIYVGDASAESLANSLIVNCRGAVINKGHVSVDVYRGTVGVPRTRAIVLDAGVGSNITFDYAEHSSYGNSLSTSVGTISLSSFSNLLSFGPTGAPWNRSENRYSHPVLIKHLSSPNAVNRITEIVKPAFDGQEFVLVVPASSTDFVIIGDCPGMHTDWSASDVIFTPNARYTFTARWDAVTSEYLWDYIG